MAQLIDRLQAAQETADDMSTVGRSILNIVERTEKLPAAQDKLTRGLNVVAGVASLLACVIEGVSYAKDIREAVVGKKS